MVIEAGIDSVSGWPGCVARCVICVSLGLLLVSPFGTAGEPVPAGLDSVLAGLRTSLVFADSFGGEDELLDLDGGDAQDNGAATANSTVHGMSSGPTGSVAIPAESLSASTGTIAWWVRYDYSIATGGTVMDVGQGGELYLTYFGEKHPDHPRGGAYWVKDGPFRLFSFPAGISPDDWHYCTFTWNGDEASFYFDGRPVLVVRRNRPFADLVKRGRDGFRLAGKGSSLFDEVRVYNRALSVEEVGAFFGAVRKSDVQRRVAFSLPDKMASASVHFGARASYRISDHSLLVSIDPSWMPAGQGATVGVELLGAGGAVLLKKESVRPPASRIVRIAIPLPKVLADGDYTVRINVGKKTRLCPLRRRRFAWEGNSIGISNDVIPPWTPLQVDGQQISCWGRTYTFGALALPVKILALQPEPTRGGEIRELLSLPVRLVVETVDGEEVLSGGPTAIKSLSKSRVAVIGSAQSPHLRTQCTGVLEQDGLYKFRLMIEPKDRTEFKSIRLELALPDEQALLFNAASTDMRSIKAFLNIQGHAAGLLWDSRKGCTLQAKPVLTQAHKQVLPGWFWPHIWFGDDDRGLSVMGDNNKSWAIDSQKPCQDLVRKAGRTTLRIHLLNREGVLEKPITAVLSLQATPVRSRLPGGSWKGQKPYGWAHFDEPVIADGAIEGDKAGGGGGKTLCG